MKIYLDNAATTPIDPAVLEAMLPYFSDHFGNPSARHGFGRKTRSAIEDSRETIAYYLNANPEEIIFTSGGTEADNMALVSTLVHNRIEHVITTPLEHHAVLQTLKSLSKLHQTQISYIRHDSRGNLDIDHLQYLLGTKLRSLVSVMHANNEIGNLNDIQKIAEISQKSGSLFHTDTVQTMAHYPYNLRELPVNFLAASAHKFHGPKGIGFLYCRKGTPLSRLIHGGGQEGKLRAGTENIPGIIGLAKAMEIAYSHLEEDRYYIQSLKDRMIYKLKEALPEMGFNGNSENPDKSLYTVLSIHLPNTGIDLVQALDELGIAVSGGSACAGGSRSHVLEALGLGGENTTIRFSFSKFNHSKEIDETANQVSSIFHTALA